MPEFKFSLHNSIIVSPKKSRLLLSIWSQTEIFRFELASDSSFKGNMRISSKIGLDVLFLIRVLCVNELLGLLYRKQNSLNLNTPAHKVIYEYKYRTSLCKIYSQHIMLFLYNSLWKMVLLSSDFRIKNNL